MHEDHSSRAWSNESFFFFTERKCYFRMKSWPRLWEWWDTTLYKEKDSWSTQLDLPLDRGKHWFLLRFSTPRNRFLPDGLRPPGEHLGPKAMTGCGNGTPQLPSEGQATPNYLEGSPVASLFQESQRLTLIPYRLIYLSTTPTSCVGLLPLSASRKRLS